MPRGRRSVEREQRLRDAGVRPAPAVPELGAVGHLVREGMPEGALTRRPARGEQLGGGEPLQRGGELGFGHVGHGAQQLHRHLSPDHRRGLEHVLVALARADRCARRGRPEWSLAARFPPRRRPERTRRVRRAARRARPASARSPRRRADCRGLGPRSGHAAAPAWGRIPASRRAGSRRCGRRAAAARCARPGRTMPTGTRAARWRGAAPCCRPATMPGGLGEHFQPGLARRVERVQVLDPEHRGLAPRPDLNELAKGLEQPRAPRLGLDLRGSDRGIGHAEKLQPESPGNRVDGRRAGQPAPTAARTSVAAASVSTPKRPRASSTIAWKGNMRPWETARA